MIVLPLQRPLKPCCLKIDRRHWRELLYFFQISYCMTHFTSSTGVVKKVKTSPTTAPFYIPSHREYVDFSLTVRQSQYIAKTREKPAVVIKKGQYIPEQSFRKPQRLMMCWRVDRVEVIEGSICIRTLTVSRKCPETQERAPAATPLVKSTRKLIMVSSQTRYLSELNITTTKLTTQQQIDNNSQQNLSSTQHEPKKQIHFSFCIMNPERSAYHLKRIDKTNLQQSARLLTDQLLTQNKVWATIKPSKEQTYLFMINKITQMLEWEEELRREGVISQKMFLNFVYVDGHGQILAVATGYELTQYLRKKSQVTFLPFEQLQKYGRQLQKTIYPKDLVPGLCVYGMFTAVRPELLGRGLALRFWLDLADNSYGEGFRIFYGRSTDIKSLRLLVALGGYPTGQLKIKQNQQDLTFSFVRWHLDPIEYNSHLIDKFNQKPKL